MQRRAYVLALVLALGAAVPVSAQPNDASTASREVRQLLAAAQEQIAAGDFETARATVDSIATLGPTSQQEASFLFYLRGQVFYELGQPERAVLEWREALSIGGLPEAQVRALETTLARLAERAVPAETPSSARELLQAADQATRFGRADDAATYYEAAIEGFAAQGDAAGLARARYGLGNHLAMTRRDLEGALGQYAIAVEQGELSGEAPLLRSALGAMGAVAIAADRAEDGRAAFARLLGLLGDNEAAPRAAALFGIGEASLRLEDWPAAADAYEQWLAVVDAAENLDAQPQMLHSYALSLRLAGRANDALAIIARFDSMAENDDERRRLALQLEQDSARARRLGNVAASCWFDARAQERYVALGRKEDADALQAVIEGCSEAAID
jgi:tetratricopeptide (TPR) repeat protein